MYSGPKFKDANKRRRKSDENPKLSHKLSQTTEI